MATPKSQAAQVNSPAPSPPTQASRQTAYETVKQAILAGDLAPSQPLVEVALARWCGVSRTPIREALLRLEQDGLVHRDSHGGVSVRERSPEEILDLYETRIVLEAAAARVASERRTDHDMRTLRWSLDRCRDVADGDTSDAVSANQQFHSAVWQATHNESLIDLLQRLNLHLARYPGTTLASPGRWSAAIKEHEQLLAAIEGRDAARAEELARIHFTEARDIRLELFARELSGATP